MGSKRGVFFKHSRRCVSCSWGGYDVHVGGTASPLAAGLMTSGIGMMAGGVIQMLSRNRLALQANRTPIISRLMHLGA
jgi:predicted phage tail protein